MRRPNPLSQLALVALAGSALVAVSVLGGCGSAPAHTLGPVDAYRADARLGDTSELKRLETLEVPENAELSLHPLWWVGSLHEPEPQMLMWEAVRLQVILRLVRDDGGTLTWTVVRDNAPYGDQASAVRRFRREGRYRQEFSRQVIGPVRAASVVALEVIVSELDPQAVEGALPLKTWQGGAVILEAPGPLTTDPGLLARLERDVRARGGDIELAVRVPVARAKATKPSDEVFWLVLVEAEPHPKRGVRADTVKRLRRVARLVPTEHDRDSAVAAADGAQLSEMSAIAFAVRVHVPDHDKGHKPGEQLDERDPDEEERHQRPPPTKLSGLTR